MTAKDTTEFIGVIRQFLRAAGRRVAEADEWELAELLSLETDLADAIQAAVDGQRANYGKSWAMIAAATGRTRQAAQMRWGHNAD